MRNPPDFDYIFLFFVNPALLYFSQNYDFCADREPKYAEKWMLAYMEAFKNSSKALTADFIRNIHKNVMSHEPSEADENYKLKATKYPVIFPITYVKQERVDIISWDATPEGISEFIRFWLVNRAEPAHSLVIMNKHDKTKGYSLKNNVWNTHPTKPETPPVAFDSATHLNMIYRLAQDNGYEVFIHSFNYSSTAAIMKELINVYHRDIAKDASNDGKIETIVKLVMHIYQLNPFTDSRANLRTCYILLNKLLTDNGLTCTLLMNPNRLGGCSADELVKMVKQGQTYVTEILHNELDEYCLRSNKEMEPSQPGHKLYPRREKMEDVEEELVQNFVKMVLMKNQIVNPLLYKNTTPSNNKNHSITKVSLFKSITQLPPKPITSKDDEESLDNDVSSCVII